MELHQSSLYLSFVKKLAWHIQTVDGTNIIFRHFFLLGGLAKLQRCDKLPDLEQTILFIRDKRIKTIAIEPSAAVAQYSFDAFCVKLKSFVRLSAAPYLPTKTILIDLRYSTDSIFNNFSQSKRRAVRRATKNNIRLIESMDINAMIAIKSRSVGLLGSITTYGLRELWDTFGQKRAAILLAYSDSECVGGVFLLYHKKTAYYWIVGSTTKGKKLFAPTLLVWEALKLSKRRGSRTFDFVGVWDEREPRQNREWIGFTKFKEGFGGNVIYYPIVPKSGLIEEKC